MVLKISLNNAELLNKHANWCAWAMQYLHQHFAFLCSLQEVKHLECRDVIQGSLQGWGAQAVQFLIPTFPKQQYNE